MSRREVDLAVTWSWLGFWAWVAVFVGVLLLVLLGGCATYQAVTDAPEEFWFTLEQIIGALFEDLATIVDYIL